MSPWFMFRQVRRNDGLGADIAGIGWVLILLALALFVAGCIVALVGFWV